MRRALIAGCGYLGRAIADLLKVDRWAIEAWTMSPDSARELCIAGFSADNVDISSRKHVGARKSHFDVVIHSASTRGGDADAYRSVYLDGARDLLETFPDAQFIFVSSTSVYAQSDGVWVTEESPTEPRHETGKILRESENLVGTNTGIVVRLAGLYGPGRSALLRKFLAGEATIDPSNDRFVNQIHRDDAAAAILFLIQQAKSNAGIYNVVDNEPVLLSQCYRWLAGALNQRIPPVAKSTSPRKRGDSSKRVSNEKLRSLGWTPKYPSFADGMSKSVFQSGGDSDS
jgi:nucleoside-diphosphate-sugar epimerase